ncbi:MAG: hypothetical protein ABSA26_16260 [Thermoguttaceae bacterium]|jgi:hypothetical protein
MDANVKTLARDFRSLANTFRGLLTKQWPIQDAFISYVSYLEDEAGRLLIYACTKGFLDSPELQQIVKEYLESVRLHPRSTLRPSFVFSQISYFNVVDCSITPDTPYVRLTKEIDFKVEACERIADLLTSGNKPGGQADTQTPQYVVSKNPPQITIDGNAYALTATAVTFMNELIAANGEWINGHSVVKQPSRIVASMPLKVRSIVKSATGKGFRLNPKKVIQ